MRATVLALALMSISCARILPWGRQPTGEAAETNLAFVLDRNLIRFETVRIDHQPGVFILGSATPRTVLDAGFAAPGQTLQMNERETVDIAPLRLDLGNVADAIVGVETWNNEAVTIDYHIGMVTYQKQGIVPGRTMSLFTYDAEPMIYVNVDGVDVAAIVDTTSPDTIVLPSETTTRGTARVRIAGTDFGPTDVQYAEVQRARVGNRLLSRFMVSIDYGRRTVGLWRDPRIPI